MLNFRFSLPTEIFFGEGQLSVLKKEAAKFGKTVLLVYGQGSIKQNGIYDAVISELNAANMTVIELADIKPNPDIDRVREGANLCREHTVSLVLAVGGGSVIDCAKAIAAARYYSGDSWDIFLRKTSIKKALPIGVVLTLAATGSEMNAGMVISNRETKQKLSSGSIKLRPRFSILDPTHTNSVPIRHIKAGIVDTISHVFEQYFSNPPQSFLQDRISEAVLKTVVNYAQTAIAHPENYEARSNLLWASTIGLNGILGAGKEGDWATHMIEHEVSAIYDTVIHGEGLAVLTPHWMRFILDDSTAPLFANYGRNVWNIIGTDTMEIASQAIEKTVEFFQTMSMPTTLTELGVAEETLSIMAEKATINGGTVGRYKKLTAENVVTILRNAL